MKFLRLPFVLMLSGVLGLAGCSVHQPVSLYQLDSGEPGQPKQSAGMAVVLGPVSVADYLQRETLLQRQTDGSLTASTEGRWAGSLSADIDQLLVRQLAWRLDSQRVVLAPANTGFNPDVQVLLSITRLDSGTNQPAILDAQWRLLDRRGQVRDNRIVHLEQPHTGTSAAQVQAQGQLLQRLAEQLSVALKPLANQPAIAEETPKKSAPVQVRKDPEKPKIPLASPIRTDMEVFRF
ncbi:PqiC family protein [Pseudomonas fontis]|uniref:ABC-type transport auxiliary lipoprotein family protein n=1 Tax=Pseudomonas fontis TaxID=2942633 RepID=A0ABT5NX69_9PSED|nr:ABC-type transport auxiliary lipoprotein family protein [Pseudomonas fontis]MDD0977375.1 ABC-type transport auxiliary lipoprotein family protein [Pseudomonas fontis]MDD0992688.1 ABC-type transport auxiliary lipoprotein family protein [Pseudomonas fontis]